jgi:hypothetical protein
LLGAVDKPINFKYNEFERTTQTHMELYRLIHFERDVTFLEVVRFLQASNYTVLPYSDFLMVMRDVQEVIHQRSPYDFDYYLTYESGQHKVERMTPEYWATSNSIHRLMNVKLVKDHSSQPEVHVCSKSKRWPAGRTAFLAFRKSKERAQRIEEDRAFFGEKCGERDPDYHYMPFRCHHDPKKLPWVNRDQPYRNHNRNDEESLGMSRWNGNACRFYQSQWRTRILYGVGEGLFRDIDFET